MELQPGLFVTTLTSDSWEPDPDVGGLMNVLCEVPGVLAGFTRYDIAPGPIPWTPEQRESVVILEGAARIEISGGPSLELHAGDAVSQPAGTETTWYVTVPFREFWVFNAATADTPGD